MIFTVAAVAAAAGALVLPSVNAQCKTRTDLRWKNQVNFADGLAGSVIYNDLKSPRGMKWDGAGHLLVIERGTGVIALSENTDGCQGWSRSVVLEDGALNHGIAINGTALYVSSADRVMQFDYDAQDLSSSGNRTLVRGIDSQSNHKTRTLVLQPARGDSPQYIIVSAGSSENVEPEAFEADHGTAQVRRFALDDTLPNDGWEWSDGELVAYGMRNAVGMVLSNDGSQLWTVENSQDNTFWNGIDVHIDNPAEELNLVNLDDIGKFYGYPRCFTAWDMESVAPDSDFAVGDQFSIDAAATDEWCQDENNVVRPVLSFQAHMAPLDITFYESPSDTSRALNTDWNTHAFVSFHGSWNREPPIGYAVARVAWDGNGPAGDVTSRDGYEFIAETPDLTKCPDGCWRPVALAFDDRGRLFGTSDSTGEIFVIESSSSPEAGGQGDNNAGQLTSKWILQSAIAALAGMMLYF